MTYIYGCGGKGEFGKKAEKIIALYNAGVRIPYSLFVDKRAFSDFLSQGVDDKTFLDFPLPKDLESELQQIPQMLYAVRSSASAEDSDSLSFAGMYDSFLMVEKGDVGQRIRQCWYSSLGKRVRLYRERNNISFVRGDMGVIIQEMILGEKSGVTFTKNPVSGEDELVIEVVNGLCEKLVSGSETPSTYFLNHKEKSRIADARLSDGELEMLIKNASKIEGLFSVPQDIEWTIRNRELYILQTRPITRYSS